MTADGSVAATGTPMRRRRRVLAVLVAVAVLLAVGGIYASTWVKSPQQVAADTDPPEPSVITAMVESRVLTQTVVLRGDVSAGATMNVVVDPSGEARSVVSAQKVDRGDEVDVGTVAIEVSGRPVIALPGAVPAYRDLHMGAEGTDVTQLQTALRAVGYQVFDTEGVFGPSTALAVENLYLARDYAPPKRAGEQDEPEAEDGEDGAENAPASPPADEVYLPMNEVVFLADLPAEVTGVGAKLGDVVGEEPVLELSLGELVAHGLVPATEEDLVQEGMPVRILNEQMADEVDGEVVTLNRLEPDEDHEQREGLLVSVRGDEPIPEHFSGANVRMTIEAAATDGEVLVVPSAAVHTSAEATTRVIRVSGDGTEEDVTVTVGASGGGFVEVRSPDLAEGDRVVIGQ